MGYSLKTEPAANARGLSSRISLRFRAIGADYCRRSIFVIADCENPWFGHTVFALDDVPCHYR